MQSERRVTTLPEVYGVRPVRWCVLGVVAGHRAGHREDLGEFSRTREEAYVDYEELCHNR